MRNSRQVFIIHGRNDAAVNAMKSYLRAIGLLPENFESVRLRVSGVVTIADVVRQAFAEAAAILVLWTPDEWSDLRPSLRQPNELGKELGHWQPRANVILEAGAAVLGDPKRTLIVSLGATSVPSDFHGLHLQHMSNDAKKRHELRTLLSTIGCEVDLNSIDHLDSKAAGDFESCVSLPETGGVISYTKT
jgi:predicted nucleotide-binding protein